ncbi:hypothetical protein CSX02_12600 [Agathobacter ruminis]|uniref:Uncharacterized protein n=2 Tax=Agathobacter ruminis TaxID=1712665 RepID=A0A2G3DZJ0_9FIRM|nr:hypothetical protein CSX02_12600 [Agathobacter ruminis]
MFERVNYFAMSSFAIFEGKFIDFFFCYAHILLIQVIFGIFIYRHFCSSSAYYFTRVNNRRVWWLHECMRLLVRIFLVMLAFLCLICIIPLLRGDIDLPGVILAFYYWIIYGLWTYAMTCMINILAITFGSYVSFVIVTGFQFFWLVMFLPVKTTIFHNKILLHTNPLSHLIFDWHSSIWNDLNLLINEEELAFDLNESVIFMFVLALLLTLIGMEVVQRVEFVKLNREE